MSPLIAAKKKMHGIHPLWPIRRMAMPPFLSNEVNVLVLSLPTASGDQEMSLYRPHWRPRPRLERAANPVADRKKRASEEAGGQVLKQAAIVTNVVGDGGGIDGPALPRKKRC